MLRSNICRTALCNLIDLQRIRIAANWKWKKYEELKTLLGIAMIANTSFAAPVVDKVAAVVNNGVVLKATRWLMQSVKLNAGQAGQQLPDDATLRHLGDPRGTFDHGSNYPADGSEDGVKITDEQLISYRQHRQTKQYDDDQMCSRLASTMG